MKMIHALTRQSGFFDVGLGLLLTAISFGIGLGIDAAENKEKETVVKQQPRFSADPAYVSRHPDSELPRS